ncbi:MAG: CHAT domain-containing protein [Chitinophagales bacterium]
MNLNSPSQTLSQADILFANGEKLFQQNKFDDYYDLFEGAASTYLEYEKWESYMQCLYKMAYWEFGKNRLSEAQKSVENVLNLHQQKTNEDTLLKGDLYELLSRVYFDEREYEESLKVSELSLKIYKSFKFYKGMINAYIGIGNVYNHTFRHREAVIEYYKALKIQSRYHIPERGDVYLNTANAYRLLSSFFLAENYYQKALSFFEKEPNKYLIPIANTKTSLGEIAALNKEYESAKSLYQEALEILNNQQGNHDLTAMVFIRVAEVYAAIDNWEEAENYFQKAINLQRKNNPTNYEWFSITYNIWGHVYCNREEWVVAENHFQKSLEVNELLAANKDMFKAKNHLDCANVLQKQGELEKALFHIGKAVHHQKMAYTNQRVSNPQVLFELEFVRLNINHQFFKNTQAEFYLQKALQIISSLSSLIEKMQVRVFQENDQLSFNQEMTLFYQLAIDILYKQYLIEPNEGVLKEIFTFSEKNKVHSLLSTIKNLEALQLANIPKEQLQKLELFQTKIIDYQTELQKIKKEQEIDQYAEELMNLQVAYHELVQSIGQNHPEYLHLRHQTPEISLQTLQDQLVEEEVVLAYTLTEDFLYILCIASEENSLQRVAVSKEFYQWIERFIDEGILGMNRKTYVHEAYQLYQILIAPIEDKLVENKVESLLIIPDNRLLELPFESLLTQEASFRTAYSDMPYLLKGYSVRYHYSTTLRQYQQNRKANLQDLPSRFLGFAPVYDEGYSSLEVSEELEEEATRDVSIRGKNYKALLYSEKEVNDIQSNFQKKGLEAKTYLRGAANLSDFKKQVEAQPAKYLHIAAHGVSNQKKNVLGVLFSPENETGNTYERREVFDKAMFRTQEQTTTSPQNTILYAHELYQLKLRCDLVFLSCCESGVGKISEGEGILSLNRGLLYSGVSNIVFTLFKIYDQKTAQFAHHFYDYLLNQKENYAQALRYAKLQLIIEDLPPKYWSGFLLLGE